jgi:hypothetical protein
VVSKNEKIIILNKNGKF